MCKTFPPVIDDIPVANCFEKLFAIVRLQQKTAQIGERPPTVAFEEGKNGVVEHGSHLIAPTAGKPLEYGHEVRCQEILLKLGVSGKDVEANRIFLVGRIEKHNILGPRARDDSEQLVDKVAVRIEHGDSLPLLNVLADEVEQKCRLPGAAR